MKHQEFLPASVSISLDIRVGCCGWSYLNTEDFRGQFKKRFSSKLQAYAQLFDLVEINSTFYRTPRVSTAQKWLEEARAVNENFGFTVKAYQGITHLHRFREESIPLFEQVREICLALNAQVILFQSPASFRPTGENIQAMKSFFRNIDRSGHCFAWEPRGTWYDNTKIIEEVCAELNLLHCVDPLRNDPLYFGKESAAYFRLHGFGKPSMYHYKFSEPELRKLRDILVALRECAHRCYVLFNNVSCYEDALQFGTMMGRMS
jgi:uncharacterized protein YecE (DUF72 family)